MSRSLLMILPMFALGCGSTAPPDSQVQKSTSRVSDSTTQDPGTQVAKPVVNNWPVFRGNAESTGSVATKLPDELEERWVFSCGDWVESAPAIVDGVVYITSTDKYLYAVDLTTGKEKWKTKLGIMKAAPAVRDGRIYVGDVGGVVFCVDVKTGEKVWQYDSQTGGEIVSGCNFHGENILVAAQGMPVTCLNPKGEAVWKYEIDGGSNGCPTVSGDVVFASGCDSRFHAIDAKTGKEIWAVDITGQAAATSAVANGIAYVGTVTNQVLAIDLTAKKVLWEFEPKVKSQAFYSSAALSNELVILGSRDQKVYALDRKTGEPKWTFVTEGMVDPSPVIAGDRVYVGCLSQTAEFYVLDVNTGKKLQELTLDSAATGSPAVGSTCLLVGTEKGKVYCLGKK